MFPMIPIYPMIPNLMKLGISHDEPPTIYSLLNSYVNYSKEEPVKIADLARTGRVMFFDFEYPLAEGMNKADFETMILNHFLMRRIGYETVTAFKIALNVKMNEIMPMYNKLFEAIENWQIFNDGETGIGFKPKNLESLVAAIDKFINLDQEQRIAMGKAGRKKMERSSNDNRTSSSTTNTTSNNTSDRRFSDTPQKKISDVQSGEYVTDYNYDRDTGNATGKSDITDKTNTDEIITRTPSDKMKLYNEFLKNRQNIYTMIFKDLDSLFYQLI